MVEDGWLVLVDISEMRHVGIFFFFSSRRRHTRFDCDWSSDVCSSDLNPRKKSIICHPSSLLLLAKFLFAAKRHSVAAKAYLISRWTKLCACRDSTQSDRKSVV